MKLNIQNIFINELPADENLENSIRQVDNACFSFVDPTKTKAPKIIHVVTNVANEIGLTENDIQSDDFLNVFTGNNIYPNTKPFAMAYAGHQFGNWAGQLGDGRAISLFEVEHESKSWMLQLKGAGKTPYSRRGDGLAVLRSSIREHLCSEAMFHLGVPTTRSLSLALTGDEVLRDVLYNGNVAYEKGAVVCRMAPSFIRFGNFELFAAKNDVKNLQILADYTIKHHFPEIKTEGKEKYIAFFKTITDSTKEMILHWQRVGFVHGVMNTDNMSVHGITIDYGPYGWLEDFNPNWTPNTTDAENKRYRFGNQPNIALWNLLQLANALYPLIEDVKPLETILEGYSNEFQDDFYKMMSTKLGFENLKENDASIIDQLLAVLQETETDMTIFYRNLSTISKTDSPEKGLEKIQDAFYTIAEVKERVEETWLYWFTQYINRLQEEEISDSERKGKMNLVNPKYVLRNYMAQLAIDAADKKDYSLIDELYTLLQKPYDEQPEMEKWFIKRPDWARVKIGCSMLSCSS
ncbi:protein adenylyltransferase SelO [Flavobacterium sp.]|uniref:protein adenylyltransferase SelO n=1 Tax=Flavobacterium sp. TaxID=239 RepID=UPI002A7F876A|nr:YdiU family protein [Flavobacterium sp.]